MISVSQWKELSDYLRSLPGLQDRSFPDSLRDSLGRYLSLLLAKNEELNLTAIRDAESALWKHLADSLAVLQWESLGTVVDWGSGGGLPGFPILLARKSRGESTEVHFLDSVGKKVKALEEFGLGLNLNGVKYFNGRGEQLLKEGSLKGIDTVVMRAVAPAERAVHWLDSRIGRWVLLLGPQQRDLWESEMSLVRKKGLRVGREASFELPQGQGSRRLLELVKI